MASAITMESGAQNGTMHTNHDRDCTMTNGITSEPPFKEEASLEKQKMASGANPPPVQTLANGSMDVDAQQQIPAEPTDPASSRLNDLPPEIQHITAQFKPLGFLLSQLARKSHYGLEECIDNLAKRPLPVGAAVNGGSSDVHGLVGDDMSPENLQKKKFLLDFVQEEHTNWTKALVITEWSKKAGQVSKLIDLRFHLNRLMTEHDNFLGEFYKMKRDLTFATLPSPDLKTAIYVLSRGSAPWMPDLSYIAPPPLSPQEKLKWIENINTILSLRLSLEDHDKIPYHFQDYSIHSGRAIFKVMGEFEVDLTIADEDPEKQMWFIDFRFLCSPAPRELSEWLRAYLELAVNEKLATEGLMGCYKFLHEYVLTHKIRELTRQATELRRARWSETLKVEQLNRAMAIQYWVQRYPPTGPKSWIIIGVHSGKKPDAAPHPKFTSRLSLRWFRDNKEVKDFDMPIDIENLSAEKILLAVIAKHTEHILSTIYAKLASKPRFANRQASVRLSISEDDPAQSFLRMQLTHSFHVTARIDPITGYVSFGPHSRIVATAETHLNNSGKDPAEDGVNILDSLRCTYASDELNRRGRSFGWNVTRTPVRPEDVRQVVNMRDNYQVVWFKRQGWDPRWQVMASLSLSGDRWWLIEL